MSQFLTIFAAATPIATATALTGKAKGAESALSTE